MNAVLTLVSRRPEAVGDRQAGGRLERAFTRNAKLRTVVEQSLQPDGNYGLTEDVSGAFQRVFRKATQGVFFALYGRLVPAEQVELLRVEDRRIVTREQVILELRPNPLVDITDEPVSEISPSSWHTREPVFIMKMAPVGGGKAVERIFRLKRDTDEEWISFQDGILSFAFVKHEPGGVVCVFDVWEAVVVAVRAPWPDDRGPLRKGRRNPFSREAPSVP